MYSLFQNHSLCYHLESVECGHFVVTLSVQEYSCGYLGGKRPPLLEGIHRTSPQLLRRWLSGPLLLAFFALGHLYQSLTITCVMCDNW